MALTKTYEFQRIDVFTQTPFCGKPITVFTNATGLSDLQMQQIARELNTHDTVFVFHADSSEHDYRVRIFSPRREVPSSGRPTLGTAFALATETRGRSRVVFEAPEGPVSTSMLTPITTVKQQVPEAGNVYREPGVISGMLSLDPSEIRQDVPTQAYFSGGTPFLLVPLKTEGSLRNITFRREIWERTLRRFEASVLLLFTLTESGNPTDAHIRVLFPQRDPFEDPATESAAGPMVRYLTDHGLRLKSSGSQWTFQQGQDLGRPSQIYAFPEWHDGVINQLRVGGQCVKVGQGSINVPQI